MQLTDLTPLAALTVLRDGSFASLGLLGHRRPGMLVFLESEHYLDALLENSHAACVLTNVQLAERIPEGLGLALAENPRRTFFQCHNALAEQTDFYWREFPSEIAGDARISPAAHIAETSVRIGRRTAIEPGVVVLPHSIIGDDVVLRAGCVIGAQGFEFMRLEDEILPVRHAGGVSIEDRVEIQANSVVDRAVFDGFTLIGEDTKIDNLVQVAHHVQIGKRCLIGASAMISGSVTIGDDVWVGPSAVISSEISVGNGASVTLGAVVTRDVTPGQRVSGHFAIDHDKFIAFVRSIR